MVGKFLNLWATQIALDARLQGAQLTWERHFWNAVVTKGSRTYDQGLKLAFYENKAKDM